MNATMQSSVSAVVAINPMMPPLPGSFVVPLPSSDVQLETSQPSITQIAETVALAKPASPSGPSVKSDVTGAAPCATGCAKAMPTNASSAPISIQRKRPEALAVGFTPPMSKALAPITHSPPATATAAGWSTSDGLSRWICGFESSSSVYVPAGTTAATAPKKYESTTIHAENAPAVRPNTMRDHAYVEPASGRTAHSLWKASAMKPTGIARNSRASGAPAPAAAIMMPKVVAMEYAGAMLAEARIERSPRPKTRARPRCATTEMRPLQGGRCTRSRRYYTQGVPPAQVF